MKRSFFLRPLLVIFLVFVSLAPSGTLLAGNGLENQTGFDQYEQGKILVKFSSDLGLDVLEGDSAEKRIRGGKLLFVGNTKHKRDANSILNNQWIESIEPFFKGAHYSARLIRAKDGTMTLQEIEKTRINTLRQARNLVPLPVAQTVTTLSNIYQITLRADKFQNTKRFVDFLSAQPYIEFAEQLDLPTLGISTVPNDPLYPDQWTHNNTAFNDGTPGADINTQEAWDTATGTSTVIVAVLDSGITPHSEFSDRLLDGTAYYGDTTDKGKNDISNSSPDGHGTQVAGIIGAEGNNGQGLAGICWSCKMIPIRIVDSGGSGSKFNLAAGIGDAVSMGADVINMSIGYSNGTATLQAAVQNAFAAGVTMVASRGNYNFSNPQFSSNVAPVFPASYPEVISVGGLSPCDQRKSASSCDGENWFESMYADTLSILAPGTKVDTTSKNGGYVNNFNGTSASAPEVSGVVALMLSVNPTLTPTQVRQVLESTAVDLGSAGYDSEHGYGKVNAEAAVLAAQALLPVSAPPLLAQWNFDEQTWNGANAVTDSVNANHATAFGGAYPTSSPEVASGTAAVFDGIDDYIKTPIVFTSQGALSISAWYKTNNIGKDRMAVVGGNAGGRFERYVHQGKPGCRVWKHGEKSIYATEQFTGDWHHVVCVQDYSVGQTRLYVDGILRATTASASDSGGGYWHIGRSGSALASSFQGMIDRVGMYSQTLDDADVQTLYTQQNIYSPVAQTDTSLLGEWKFKQSAWTSATGQVIDSSSNNNHATAQGGIQPSTVAGVQNTAANFDGINDAILTPVSFSNANDLTISAWYKTDNASQQRMTLMGGNTGGRFEMYVHQGKPGCRVWDTADRSIYAPQASVGIWTHVACIQRYGASPSTELYVNGVFITSTPRSSVAAGGAWYIGRSGSSIANYFNGTIDHPIIRARAISSAEITALYNSTIVDYPIVTFDPALTAWYKFNETAWTGQMGDVFDATGKNPAQSKNGVSQTVKLDTDKVATFDGVNDFISTPNKFTSNASITLSAWVKTSNQTKKRMTVVGDNVGGRFEVYVDQGKPGCRVWTTKDMSIFSNSTIDGQWHHIICVLDYASGQTRLYVDGVLQKQVNGVSVSAGGYFSVGKSGAALATYYEGSVDNVQLYSKAFTDAEAATLFGQG